MSYEKITKEMADCIARARGYNRACIKIRTQNVVPAGQDTYYLRLAKKNCRDEMRRARYLASQLI